MTQDTQYYVWSLKVCKAKKMVNMNAPFKQPSYNSLPMLKLESKTFKVIDR